MRVNYITLHQQRLRRAKSAAQMLRYARERGNLVEIVPAWVNYIYRIYIAENFTQCEIWSISRHSQPLN